MLDDLRSEKSVGIGSNAGGGGRASEAGGTAAANSLSPTSLKREFRFKFSFAILFTCLGISSFLVSAYVVHTCDVGDPAYEAEFKAKVDKEAYTWPMIAFGTAFCLNMLTVLFERESAKFQLAVLTCYINFLAGFADYLEWKDLSATVRGTWGHGIQILRLLMYLHTTPAMVYLLSMISDYTRSKVLKALLADVLMLTCYIMAELCGNKPLAVCLYIVAYCLFGTLIYLMWHMFDAPLRLPSGDASKQSLMALQVFSVGLWLTFPVLWFITRLGIVDINTEEWLWTTFDFIGKVIFSSSLLFGNFVTIDQRRIIAMRVVEDGNRVRVVQELKELVQQKESFLSSMSHELRTPLNGIIGLSDAMLLGSCGDLGDKVHKTISTIKTSGSRLLTLVNDILDAASMKKGTLTVKHEPVDISKVAGDVIDLCMPLAKRGVSMVKDMATFLPPVLGDTGRIIQILYNLVGNACKFTHTGFISISAHTNDEGCMVISVTDTGIGIPEEKFESIFKAFEQVDMSTTRKYGGTGLGLNLVKDLVEAHGGKITVSSVLGQKTQFSFTLKLWQKEPAKEEGDEDRASAASVAAPSEGCDSTARTRGPVKRSISSIGLFSHQQMDRFSGGDKKDPKGLRDKKPSRNLSASSVATQDTQAGPNVPSKLGTNITGPVSLHEALALAHVKIRVDSSLRRAEGWKPKILSVDDDQVNQMVIQSLLAPAGYDMLQAMNGEEALNMLADPHNLPDAILLDVMMPGMSGYEVCRKLREMHPLSCIPVIMVSAKSKEEHIVEGLASGSNDYITKPFGREEILARIAAHIKFKEDTFQAGELADALARSDCQKIDELLELESNHYSLPVTLKTELEQRSSSIFQLPVYHSATLVLFEVMNLGSMLEVMKMEEVMSALTILYWDVDNLISKHNCYAGDSVLEGTTLVICGLNGESAEDQVVSALAFAEGLLEAAARISLAGDQHLEVSIGIHTAGTQGVITGIKCPSLSIYGHLPEHACILQATCPNGCIHISQRSYGLLPQKDKCVPTRSEKSETTNMSYLIKTGNWKDGVESMPALFSQYAAEHPNGAINFDGRRPRPVQLALLKLITLNEVSVVKAFASVSKLQAFIRPTAGQLSGRESDKVGDESELAKEKGMLEMQLQEVSEEADRLQDEVDRLEALVSQHEAAQSSAKAVDPGEKASSSDLGPELTHQLIEARAKVQVAEQQILALEKQVDQLTTACLLAEEHSAELEDQLEEALKQVQEIDLVLSTTKRERDHLKISNTDSLSRPMIGGSLQQFVIREEGHIPQRKYSRSTPSKDHSQESLHSRRGPASASSCDARRMTMLSEGIRKALISPWSSSEGRLSLEHMTARESDLHEMQLAQRYESMLAQGHPLTIEMVLVELGLKELTARFEAEEVTPSLLPQMEEADFREVGVTSLGAQMLLRMAGRALIRCNAI